MKYIYRKSSIDKKNILLIIFISLFLIFSFQKLWLHSILFMPKEYKIIKKIVQRISKSNQLGNRPINFVIRAGYDMKYHINDLELCEKDNCRYYQDINPFSKYKGFRSNEINNAINLSFVGGRVYGSATSNGNIYIDRSTFKVLENKEDYIAALIAHELSHVINFDPYFASREILKSEIIEKNKSYESPEVEILFFKKLRDMESNADLNAVLMLVNSNYPKSTFLEALNFISKQSGYAHYTDLNSTHPNHITRELKIKNFINSNNFIDKDSTIFSNSKWKYDRNNNFLKFYPGELKNKISKS